MNSPINSEKSFTVAENYRKIRVFKGKSQEEVVKELKAALPGNDSIKQNVSTWETLRGNPGKTFIGHLSKILDVPLEVFYIEPLTKEYLEDNFGTRAKDSTDNKKNEMGDKAINDAALGMAYKIIMEGGTEYMLIARDLLKDKHRLVAIEILERDERIINRLMDENSRLSEQLDDLKAMFPKVEKTQ